MVVASADENLLEYTTRLQGEVMLKITARNLGTVAVISLQGQIVTGETEILRNAVGCLSEKSAVVLDLARVTTVDAHGLGVMLELREQAGSKGMRFELMNVGKQLSRVLEITRLDSVFRIISRIDFFPAVSRRQQALFPPLRSCA
jgi:anti-sigma B factor antagonist